jgi:CBS domain-containing protein/polyhydroxyalkanoate synthesis regulator phasin
MEKKIMDIMTRGVVTASVDSSVRQVAQSMLENNVSVVVIVDEQGGACGVISKTDVLKCWGKDIDNCRTEDIMSTKIQSLSPTVSLSEAAAVFTVKKIHQIVIMKGDPLESRKPIGILTIPDLVKEMIPSEIGREIWNQIKNYQATTMEIISTFQAQSEKMWNALLEQGLVNQQEGKKMLGDWLNTIEQSRKQFQETMENNLKKADGVFGTPPKNQK